MQIGRVVGIVVSTIKDEELTGTKLLIVQPIHAESLEPDGKPFVAVDTVGAGTGEIVLVVSGSSARHTAKTRGFPLDASIIGILDSIEIAGKIKFRKGE